MQAVKNSISNKELRSIDRRVRVMEETLSCVSDCLCDIKELLQDSQSQRTSYYNEVLRHANTNTTGHEEEG